MTNSPSGWSRPAKQLASKSGGCRSPKAMTARSTATPPTSKTSVVAGLRGASSAPSLFSASSTRCRGRISISPARRGRQRTRRPCRRAPPRSASGCSIGSSPNITRRTSGHDQFGEPALVEIGFYHLLSMSLERALPKLLERACAHGHRVVVRAASPERVEQLNAALWTYEEAAFLPHGSARDGNPAVQPIWLTDLDENPNRASMIVLVDGVEAEDLQTFARCADGFDGNDADAVEASRRRWR